MKWLCISGYPSGGREWVFLRRVLASAGDSVDQLSLPDGASTLLDQEHAIATAVTMQAEPVILVGHSLGAYLVARALSRLDAERVEQAVLVGGFARMPAETAAAHRGLADALEAGQLEGDPRRAIVEDLVVRPEVPNEEQHAAIDAMFMAPSGADLARMVRRGTQAADRAVEPFHVPAVVITGAEDRSTPPTLARELAALGSNARLHLVPSRGHFLQVFAPEEIAGIAR
jgi:3-oxoadipate enol-lactonase